MTTTAAVFMAAWAAGYVLGFKVKMVFNAVSAA